MKRAVIFAGVASVLLMASAGGALAAGTDYSFTTSDIGANQYGIESTPITQRPDGAWGNYSAPSGSGTFEVINGATAPDTRFWYQTQSVNAGQTYSVTAILANNYSVSAPTIQFTVDGVAQGAAVTLGGPPYGTDVTDGSPGPWETVVFTYTAATTGASTFALVDTNLDANGNDFSLASAGVPEPATWAMMLVGIGAMGATMRRRRSMAIAA